MITMRVLCPHMNKEEIFNTNGDYVKKMIDNRLVNVKHKGTKIYNCTCEYFGECPYSKTTASCDAFNSIPWNL